MINNRGNEYGKAAATQWPQAIWIEGTGHLALVAYCKETTVSLWTDLAKAIEAKDWIDDCGCGGRCLKHHFIMDLRGKPKPVWITAELCVSPRPPLTDEELAAYEAAANEVTVVSLAAHR